MITSLIMIGMKINDTNHSSPCLERCNVARDRDFDVLGQMEMEMVVTTTAVDYDGEEIRKFDSLLCSFLFWLHLPGELLRWRQIGQNWARAHNQKWPKSQNHNDHFLRQPDLTGQCIISSARSSYSSLQKSLQITATP